MSTYHLSNNYLVSVNVSSKVFDEDLSLSFYCSSQSSYSEIKAMAQALIENNLKLEHPDLTKITSISIELSGE